MKTPSPKPKKEVKKSPKLPSEQIPLSEDQKRFRRDWTRDDCIAELRRIAEMDPAQYITRNYFRNHSSISESTWNRYFGTFHEFKRQAAIVLSRHAHKLEKDIARHASKDTQRNFNLEKASWEGAYLRPSSRRFQTALIGSDLHDKYCDPFYRRLFLDTAKRVLPEKIVLNGDLFDLTEFSRFTQDPRQFDVIGRIHWVHDFLRDLRTASPDSEIILVEGNHEFRLIRHLTESTPALVTVLAELHNLTIPSLLGLTKFEINYIARMDLAAFNETDIRRELKKNYLILWDSILLHHFPEGRQMGYPGANGHYHRHQVWESYSPVFGPFEWHQIGCGHVRSAVYTQGEQWGNGFLLAHVDTIRRRTQFEYLDCTHDHCLIGGKLYERTQEEKLVA